MYNSPVGQPSKDAIQSLFCCLRGPSRKPKLLKSVRRALYLQHPVKKYCAASQRLGHWGTLQNVAQDLAGQVMAAESSAIPRVSDLTLALLQESGKDRGSKTARWGHQMV